jgi:hypothetical protein
VLFSTSHPARIMEMVRAAESRELTQDQRVGLACVARTVRTMTADQG